MDTHDWKPFVGSTAAVLSAYDRPLIALVEGHVPAFIFRRAYDPIYCAQLLDRFAARGLLDQPPPTTGGKQPYINVGTSFGMHHQDRHVFFDHAAATRLLFAEIFDGLPSPVRTVYDLLSAITPGQHVRTARENDGREYGPAIFRIYRDATGHGPHYDSVRTRTRALDYHIAQFKYQFAGVLCLQNADGAGGGEPFLYNCPWTPTIQEHVSNNTFHDYVRENQISRLQVELQPGDLYFFWTENVHEVPDVDGVGVRAVLAIFFAMSPEVNEIPVWA